jgi:hypothetical protein
MYHSLIVDHGRQITPDLLQKPDVFVFLAIDWNRYPWYVRFGLAAAMGMSDKYL